MSGIEFSPKISVEIIAGQIYQIRGKVVMLDEDLARLYAVETKISHQAS